MAQANLDKGIFKQPLKAEINRRSWTRKCSHVIPEQMDCKSLKQKVSPTEVPIHPSSTRDNKSSVYRLDAFVWAYLYENESLSAQIQGFNSPHAESFQPHSSVVGVQEVTWTSPQPDESSLVGPCANEGPHPGQHGGHWDPSRCTYDVVVHKAAKLGFRPRVL